MKRPVILDAGPLVAALDRRESPHEWANWQMARLQPPLLTCEAVLSEACFLLRRVRGGSEAVMDLVTRGVVSIAFRLDAEIIPVAKLLARYANVPMSLADACLVRMVRHLKGVCVPAVGRL